MSGYEIHSERNNSLPQNRMTDLLLEFQRKLTMHCKNWKRVLFIN